MKNQLPSSMEALLSSIFPLILHLQFLHFSNFLADGSWLMGAPYCRGPLVFELTLTNERYATVKYSIICIVL